MNTAAIVTWVGIIAGCGELPAGQQRDAIGILLEWPARSLLDDRCWTAAWQHASFRRCPHRSVAALLEF